MDVAHTPVLLEETLSLLAPRSSGEVMCDATLGEAGHTEAFLERFPDLQIIGIDADESIQEIAKKRLERFGARARFYRGRSQDFFAQLAKPQAPLMRFEIEKFDIVFIDLGVSLYHYAQSGRGFSFAKDEPLDMRIDPSEGQTAADIIARLPEKELAGLLYNNAEERYSRRIARAIVEARAREPIATSKRLADIAARSAPPHYRYGATHPATKTFQALRIEVNGELSGLRPLLESAWSALRNRGRLGVISFHSLESRAVKNYFRELAKNGSGRLVTKKAVAPSLEEIRANAPSRSALLRVVEKMGTSESD
ncbi:MAG: 16S rRNA (cytosine(1402)-N(4))-methyltransferase RsmH [Treponema sp.]|jgi:16S rRNA (cytosine1402-N4)-methyltransferase|nr:16S rRNA (cytosine(1402)-N(4))-methyltransferase RsmH [Treponema sp.]